MARARGADGDDALSRSAALARSGLWYDAIETLSDAVEADPGNMQVRKARAALLEQVELDEIASLERPSWKHPRLWRSLFATAAVAAAAYAAFVKTQS